MRCVKPSRSRARCAIGVREHRKSTHYVSADGAIWANNKFGIAQANPFRNVIRDVVNHDTVDRISRMHLRNLLFFGTENVDERESEQDYSLKLFR